MNITRIRSIITIALGSLLIICSIAVVVLSSSDPEVTNIVMDGNPSEWARYAVLLSDPQGDYLKPGFDIADVKAFANDQYLYVLVETHSSRGDYIQLDLEIETGGRSFVLSFHPEEGTTAFMGEITAGFVSLGEVVGSNSAANVAVELRVPLSTFDDTSNLRLRNVRPMAGECCGADWKALDQIRAVAVSRVNELEPTVENVPIPRICADEITPPAPFGTLQPASVVQLFRPGYTAEWFVAPGAFNMPLEVMIAPDGDVLVISVRSGTLHRVTSVGTITVVASGLSGYQSTIDAQGNVYLYDPPHGKLVRIAPNGSQQVIAESSLLLGYGGPVHIGDDGNYYVPIDLALPDRSPLYRITPAGDVRAVAEFPAFIIALISTPDGRVLAGYGNEISELSLIDYSLTTIARIPSGSIAYSGLAVDNANNVYVSTGSRDRSGQVYRVDADGEVSLLASIPNNGLSGIEWLPNTNEIIGAQMRHGGLVAVSMDGSMREIAPGNGIITPMGLAFSPCGELAVPNDDGGMLTLINPAGEVSWFMDYLSFIPPIPFVAFEADGTLYASEGEPMPQTPKRVIVVPPGGTLRPFVDSDMPSGLAIRLDGTLLVAETGAGRIIEINPDGSVHTLIDGLRYPQALALDGFGNVYVIAGPTAFDPDDVNPVPIGGDKLVRISPDGHVTTLLVMPGLAGVGIDAGNRVFVTANDTVLEVDPDGSHRAFATGFTNVIGLAFDLAGYLYVSDARLNAIARIGGFQQGMLEGTVVDTSGLPIQQARVQVLVLTPTVIGQVVMTDADGCFSLPSAPRTYSVIVSADGHETTTLTGVSVTANHNTILSIELE